MRLHTKVYLKVYLGLGGLSSRLAGCFVLMALVFCAGRASGQVTGRQLKPQELSPESTTMIPLEQVLGEVAAARKAIAEHRDSAEAYLRLAMALGRGVAGSARRRQSSVVAGPTPLASMAAKRADDRG
ncbi:MAG: hypothetical protein DMG24_04045 [Acidobacteria bacterium]|nr:MAG: hypothetical protein DMG24_04045 [Acidobacteriota bacterium]